MCIGSINTFQYCGGYSGNDYDKISALKELGFEFYNANHIKTLMVKGASLNVECNLYKEITLGDHIMFIGEVIDAVHNPKTTIGLS